MPPFAAQAIPPAAPRISLPVIANAIAESEVLLQASLAEGLAQ